MYFTQQDLLLFQAASEESAPGGKKKEQNPLERKDWQEKAPLNQSKERELEKMQERQQEKEKAAQMKSQEDFERTPSGRVRRQSAQVAVFHLQEIAEDELAKDWGTKRRIKDDLVPDSKRVRTQGRWSKKRFRHSGFTIARKY